MLDRIRKENRLMIMCWVEIEWLEVEVEVEVEVMG
jgi:hypothetical protein